MKTRVIALLCLLVVSIPSCNAPKNTYNSDSQESMAGETSRILFLDYQITRDSISKTYDAQLVSMIIKEGTIKDDQNNIAQAEKDDLELLVLDRNQQTISQSHIPNPLDKSVEYVNDAGQFERKMIHLDSAQFNIRLQIDPDASSILLNRFIDDDTEGTLLLNTQIQ
ncbi:MAG: hypothetical protein DRI97_14285 [Bacteroidetes bacterium]|nr:MAG: hypothetical protein DRI97_14285 [Bacteroidota bacterium]RLD93286.1 MAG: hypothetical protein DRJ29_09295 [Bacteroidota bacterium]RLE06383.1 MAG: hypothetical protein DRJ13_00360 [Bacteroidota bacterium]